MNTQKTHNNPMDDICRHCGKRRGVHCHLGKYCPSDDGAWVLGSRFEAVENGTHDNPIRYEHLDKADPEYKAKMREQLDSFERDAKSGGVCNTGATRFCGDEVGGPKDKRMRSENIANAALIASAPDMLQVLNLIYSNAAESAEWIRERIAPVIAQARGEE